MGQLQATSKLETPDKIYPLLPPIKLDEDQSEFFEERAAIKEYCGGLKREAAEEGAFQETVDYFSIRLN